jgi:hypothetical protein
MNDYLLTSSRAMQVICSSFSLKKPRNSRAIARYREVRLALVVLAQNKPARYLFYIYLFDPKMGEKSTVKQRLGIGD